MECMTRDIRTISVKLTGKLIAILVHETHRKACNQSVVARVTTAKCVVEWRLLISNRAHAQSSKIHGTRMPNNQAHVFIVSNIIILFYPHISIIDIGSTIIRLVNSTIRGEHLIKFAHHAQANQRNQGLSDKGETATGEGS